MFASDLLRELDRYYEEKAPIDKSGLIAELAPRLGLKQERKVFLAPGRYAVRFAYASKSSFSNTVLSLKKLLEYDNLPFIVCILRPDNYELRLANTSFLAKISHSSHKLDENNIRGSFLGHDILSEYQGIANEPRNFEELFKFHQALDQQENLRRLVLATARIKPSKKRFEAGPAERNRIGQSVKLSLRADVQAGIALIKEQLDARVSRNREEILAAVRRDGDNVNIRGNAIEQLVTAGVNRHGFADLEFELSDLLNSSGKVRLLIDIKTHIAQRSANPKHYNIDGLLEQLSDGRTLTYIYVIYLDPEEGTVRTNLINNFDLNIIKHTRIQFHWAGRDSRGTTQLDSGLEEKYKQEWETVFDEKAALQFVYELIDSD